MTTNSRLAAVSLLTVLGLAACDAQQPVDYVGDPLWTLRGSLVSDEGIATDTEVAILWDAADWRVLERTEVEGNFPAEFTLRTYEPPPEKALFSFSVGGMNGVIGFGNILAVPGSAPFYPALPYHGDEPDSVQLLPGETLVGEEAVWDVVRGGVPDYVVVYFEGDSGGMACVANLAQGYNLLAVRAYTEAELAEADRKYAAKLEQVLADYNAEHGTRYDEETLHEDEAATLAIDEAMDRYMCDQGYLFKVHSEVVDTDQRVSMELRADFEYLDWN
jgi:hypothetical protein